MADTKIDACPVCDAGDLSDRPERLRDYPMPPADVPLIATLRDLL